MAETELSTQDLAENILIISNNCKHIAESFGEAFKMLHDQDLHIVKIPNCKLSEAIIRRNNNSPQNISLLSDIITNFRTLDGQPLGHLDTTQGPLPVPQFWPTNQNTLNMYGLPHRREHADLLVDAYLLNNYWTQKILEHFRTLPFYNNEW